MAQGNSSQDIHICGNCRATFSDIFEFIKHKKGSCGASGQGSAAPPQPDQSTVQEATESSNGTGRAALGSSSGHNLWASDSIGNTEMVIGSRGEPVSHKSVVATDLPENMMLTSLAPNPPADDMIYLSLQQPSCNEDRSMVRYYPHNPGSSSVSQISPKKYYPQPLQSGASKEEALSHQSVSHQVSQSSRFSTDGIAIYIVSPNSFASSASSATKTQEVTANSSDDLPVSKASEIYFEKDTNFTISSSEAVRTRGKQTERSYLKTGPSHSEVACAQGPLLETAACFYLENSVASGSDNSTPCPEDLEVGQISASVLGQQPLQAPQGSGRTFSSEKTVSSATVENSPISSAHHFLPGSDQGKSRTAGLGTIQSKTLLSYIRQNTASAPTVVGGSQRKAKARVSLEKRERLPGLSDDLLSSLPRDGESASSMKTSEDVVFQTTSSSWSHPKSRCLLSSSTSSLAPPSTVTSFKAVFTSPSRSGHRLSPTQNVDLAATTNTVKIPQQVVESSIGSQLAESSSSNGKATVYKNISAAARLQGHAQSQKTSIGRNLAQKSHGRRAAERQIVFDNSDAPAIEVQPKEEEVVFPSIANCFSHSSSDGALNKGFSHTQGLPQGEPSTVNPIENKAVSRVFPVNLVTNLSLPLDASAQNPMRIPIPSSVICTSSSDTTLTPVSGLQTIAPGTSSGQIKSSQAYQRRDPVHINVSSNRPQQGIPAQNQTGCSDVVMVYKNGDGSVVVVPKNSHHRFPSQQPAPQSGQSSVPYQPIISQIVVPSNMPCQPGEHIVLQVRGEEQHFQNQQGQATYRLDKNPWSNVVTASPLERLERYGQSSRSTGPGPSINIPLKHQELTNSAQSVIYVQTAQVSNSATPCPAPMIFHTATSAAPSTPAKAGAQPPRDNVIARPPATTREPCILRPRNRPRKQNTTNLTMLSPLPEPVVDEQVSPTVDDQESKKERRFTCKFDKCRFTSSLLKDLQRHYRTHTGERPFQCVQCGKTFNRSDKLRIHLRWHEGAKPFQCNLCDYKTLESGSLKKHLRIHSDERPYKCQICPYASRNSSHLIVHLRTHTGDAPFLCTVCGAQFKINSDLKRHTRTHTGEKPFKCDHCDYRSSNKGNLKTHMRINHSKADEVRCDRCDFSSSSRKRLKEHAKTHDPSRVFRCQQCPHMCSSSKALRAHLCTHDSVKPYQCSFCPYSCKQSGNLKKHVQNLHLDKLQRSSGRLKGKRQQAKRAGTQSGEDSKPKGKSRNGRHAEYLKQHKCVQCGRGFVRLDSLRSHLNQHRHTEEQQAQKDHSSNSSRLTNVPGPKEKPVSSKSWSLGLVSATSKPDSSTPLPTAHCRPGMQHIAAAASKLFEENFVGTDQNLPSQPTVSSVGYEELKCSVEISTVKRKSGRALGQNQKMLQTGKSVSVPTNSESQREDAKSHTHPAQTHQQLPWEHSSYTLSPKAGPNNVSNTDDPNPHRTSGVAQPSALPRRSSESTRSRSLKRHREWAAAAARKSKMVSAPGMSHQSALPGSAVKLGQSSHHHCLQKEKQQQQQQRQQQIVVNGQLQHVVVQPQLAAPSTQQQPLVFTHQAMQGDGANNQEPSFNFQLVPQVLDTSSSRPSHASIIAQQLVQPVAVAPQGQVPPAATHIQIVWPGTTIHGQSSSQAIGLPSAHQQIVLQDCDPSKVEVVSIPYKQIPVGPTPGQGPSTKVFQTVTSTGTMAYTPEQGQIQVVEQCKSSSGDSGN